MVYFIQNVQKQRRYKFEIYVKISTGTTISQEILKQTVNKNNIHVLVGVSQVSQLVVMILLINDCYIMSLVVIISRMNFVLYRNNCLPSITKNKIEKVFENHNCNYSFQSFSSLSIDASFCLYQADLATGWERQLTTGKCAERTKHDFWCPICRSAIGQAGCLICARRRQLTFPFCC